MLSLKFHSRRISYVCVNWFSAFIDKWFIGHLPINRSGSSRQKPQNLWQNSSLCWITSTYVVYISVDKRISRLVMSFVLGNFSDRGRLLSLARTHWSLMWLSMVMRCKMDKSIIVSLLLLASSELLITGCFVSVEKFKLQGGNCNVINCGCSPLLIQFILIMCLENCILVY